jgi:hypothetical protein
LDFAEFWALLARRAANRSRRPAVSAFWKQPIDLR